MTHARNQKLESPQRRDEEFRSGLHPRHALRGATPEVSGAATDAERRLRAELETRQLEVELQNEQLQRTQLELVNLVDLYEHAPFGYVTTSREGLIRTANLRFAQMLGRPRDVVVAQPFSDCVHPDDEGLYAVHRKSLLAGTEKRSCELRLRRGARESLWVMLQSEVVKERDGSVHLRSAVIDVTERRQADEEERRSTARLLESRKMEAVSALAGGVAHDMNNVLAVILALGSRLERHLPDDGRTGQDLRDLISAVFRGKKLTQDLLDLANKRPPPREACSANDAIRSVAAELQRTLPERLRFELVLNAQADAIECGPDELSQMLMQLCLNSADAMAGRGMISIATRNLAPGDDELCDFPELCSVPHLCIEVADDGCGMDPETLRRAFEPFFTTKEVGKGSGLGLAMVYAAVRDLGGEIRVTSELDRGTTVRILLPAHPSREVSPSEPPDTSRTPLMGGTVLLVDDEPLVRSAFRATLEDLGYRVITADGGPAALATYRAERNQIDVVLLDLSMPLMDGAECYWLLKQIDADARVVFCTGHAPAEVSTRLPFPARPPVVSKPCTQAELIAALAEAMKAAPATCDPERDGS